jgi:predicted transcriptional regulator
MHQLLIELDDELMERLDRFAPARSRKRSEFIGALRSQRHREVKRALGYALDWAELKIVEDRG